MEPGIFHQRVNDYLMLANGYYVGPAHKTMRLGQYYCLQKNLTWPKLFYEENDYLAKVMVWDHMVEGRTQEQTERRLEELKEKSL